MEGYELLLAIYATDLCFVIAWTVSFVAHMGICAAAACVAAVIGVMYLFPVYALNQSCQPLATPRPRFSRAITSAIYLAIMVYGLALCFAVAYALSVASHMGICARAACVAAVLFPMVFVPMCLIAWITRETSFSQRRRI
jgi:hypothetical protein